MSLVKRLRIPLLPLALLCFKNGIGNEVKISNVEDFKTFVEEVNLGTTNYSGTTVFLDSDLSLSEITEPVGKDTSNYFRGVFDGQGHIISDYKLTSSAQYSGLFGFSNGLTIRNVVLDSSCSITSSYSGSGFGKTGGIIGYCDTKDGGFNIENSVNIADVTFSGDSSSKYLRLGGVVGQVSYAGYSIYVKNCVNYGSVTYSGTTSYPYIGGIVGGLSGSSHKQSYLYNCLNYGTITHNGTTSGELDLGGISGYSDYVYIENCVSAGKISTQNTPSDSYVGSIVGYVKSGTSINYCYCTSELSEYNLYSYGTPESTSYTLSYDNTTFELSGTASIGSYTGTSLVGVLNAYSDYYVLRDYSKWLLNKDSKTVTFTTIGRTNPITMNYQIILIPSFVSGGKTWFDGWYNDNGCTRLLDSFETTEDKMLYGKFEENTNNYTITFDTRREGVSVAPITAQFGTAVQLPSESSRDYCSVGFWENEYGDNVGLSLAMPAHNFTLYAVWKCTHIAILDDFIDFSKVVNSGADNYNGTTVYLDSDLSLSGITEPVGKDTTNYFRGVFDGQGHVISDFKLTSTQYSGLFGYSQGLTIRNVVTGSSCSMKIFYDVSNAYIYIGGIIGYCSAKNGGCNIENSVNMADAIYNEETNIGDYYLYVGGIVGCITSYSSYTAYVKNCANYGSVSHLNSCGYHSYIGGIAGSFSGSYLQNCLNYGAITHSGSTAFLYVGGFVGQGGSNHIENCVNAGEISAQNVPPSEYVGSIIGSAYSGQYINNSFWTSDVGLDVICGSGSPTVDDETSQVEVNKDLVDKLNNYASMNSTYNKWLLNTNNETISFIVNNRKGFDVDSQIVLLPGPAVDGTHTFSGWHTDAMLTLPFTDDEVNVETRLYGMICETANYVVTLDVNGGDVSSVSSLHPMLIACNNMYGDLPETNRTGYTFVGWFTESEGGDKIESGDSVTNMNDHTLYAHWSANNYTVTFDVNGGNELTENEKTITFDSEYGELPDTTKEGYTFIGWFTNKTDGTAVTSKTKVNTPNNHTLYAKFTANNYTVTFDVNGGNELVENKKPVIFNNTYGTLPKANRTGYMFLGWFTDKTDGTKVTNKAIVTIPNSHTLYAHWEEVTNQVEIVFNSKNLTREDVEKIVQEYVDEGTEFTIVEISTDETGETKVIIKFTETEEAEEFIRTVNELGRDNNNIKRIGFASHGDNSFSMILYPILFILAILF